MTGHTPLYAIPYPTAADQVADLDTILQDQAEQIESTIAGLGGLASPGSWTNVSFGSGWGNYGSGFQTVQYRKVGSQVFLRGLLSASSGQADGATAFTLPAGFRPQATLVHILGGSATWRFDLRTNGVFGPVTTGVSAGAFISLDDLPPFWID